MQLSTRHLPLPLAAAILLIPVAGFLRASACLEEVRAAECRQRQLTEATVVSAWPIVVEIYKERRGNSSSERG